MENKKVSKKVPIILAIAWFAVGLGVLWFVMPEMIRGEGWARDWVTQMLVFLAELAFSVVMMALVRVFSVKAQIKWLATVSKVLLIVYSIIGGIGLIAFIVIKLIGM